MWQEGVEVTEVASASAAASASAWFLSLLSGLEGGQPPIRRTLKQPEERPPGGVSLSLTTVVYELALLPCSPPGVLPVLTSAVSPCESPARGPVVSEWWS